MAFIMKKYLAMFIAITVPLLSIFIFQRTQVDKRTQVDITVVGPVVAAGGLGRNTIDFFDVLRTKYKVNK
jgi:hypothetical protein